MADSFIPTIDADDGLSGVDIEFAVEGDQSDDDDGEESSPPTPQPVREAGAANPPRRTFQGYSYHRQPSFPLLIYRQYRTPKSCNYSATLDSVEYLSIIRVL